MSPVGLQKIRIHGSLCVGAEIPLGKAEMNELICSVVSRKHQKECGWKHQSKAGRGEVHKKPRGKKESFPTRSDNKADWMNTLKSFQPERITRSSNQENRVVKVKCGRSLQKR